MANLRVDKITSTETFETTGSVQFDGSGDYLETTLDAFGTSEFTIEYWIAPNSISGSYVGTVRLQATTTTKRIEQAFQGSTLQIYTDTGAWRDTGFAPPTSQWTHIALVKYNNKLNLYANGSSVWEVTNTRDYDESFNVDIGSHVNSLNGNISNVRIIKGTALYTANFKPPMRELEVVPGTVLLACQSKTDATLEKTGKTITVTGNAVASELTPGILTPVPKAGAGSAITGSVEFNGGTTSNPGDYLSVPNTEDLRLGSSDFTVEAYVNFSNGATNNGVIVALWDNTNNQRSWNLYFDRSNGLYFAGSTNGSSGNNNVNASIDIEDGEWYHVAACRSGSTIKLFVNGVERASNTSVGTYYDNTTDLVTIGAQNHDNLVNFWKGFISNLRIVKGTALYTDDFIPPTRELKKVPGTVLLCCQDPDNPLTEATGKTITGYGSLSRTDIGVNLVTNGDFSVNTDGWSVLNTGTFTASGGQATLSDSDGTGTSPVAYQEITTFIPGAMYVFQFDTTAAREAYAYVSTTAGSNTLPQEPSSTYANPAYTGSLTGTRYIMFRATQSTMQINFSDGSGSDFDITVDNVKVYKLDPGNKASNFTPQVGDDRKVTFEGVTKINTENYFYLPTGNTVTRDSRSGRGLIAGGFIPGSEVNNIEYVTIASSGNAQDFGDLTVARRDPAGCASATRGIVFAGGFSNNRNVIDYVEISTTSNAIDFGDTTENSVFLGAAVSNSTRGVFAGGIKTSSPIRVNPEMQYVTIASRGDTLEFGELSVTRYAMQGAGSPTRGMFFGGAPAPAPAALTNTIDYITIAATGNAVDFGDISVADRNMMTCSNSIRSVIAGGQEPSAHQDRIEYVTNASTGNAQDFGNLITSRSRGSAASSQTRGLIFGGYSPSNVNTIDYVTFATTGNASDFGDTTQAIRDQAGFSDSHGGLG